MTSLATVHQPITHNAALSVLAGALGALDLGLQEELAHCGVLAVRLAGEVELWVGVGLRERPARSATSTKVLVVLEPPEIRDFATDGVDIVLTFRQDHLDSLLGARLFIPATPWLVPAEWPKFHGDAKRCCLGFLRGSKTRTTGHKLRHDIWAAQERCTEVAAIPLEFEAGGDLSRDDRNRQFNCRFVLVVENSRLRNYFTEKLLDALLAQCIPLYWGCPNIGDFFDAAGIIQVDSVDAVVAACAELSGAAAEGRSEAVGRNFEAARSYAGDFGRRLQQVLEPCFPVAPSEAAAEVAPS